MQNRWLGAALMAACCSFIGHVASAAPINCSAANVDVERAICSHPELLARDQAISVRLDTLKQRCPDARQLIVEGQKFWLRERWDCRNVEGVFEAPGRLGACLASRMDLRLRQLNAVGDGCDFAPLFATYRFVDVDYLQRFSNRYIGKNVSIFGQMDLASCDASGASPTAATIIGTDRKRKRFRAKFSAMPAGQREFLCAKHPAAHWTGTVEHDSLGDYLFLKDVLGQELPPS